MKTPLTYYGGKQQMAATILRLIPEHKMYVEPFIGGAAIYFAKEPSKGEVINDTNGELVNFYEVVKRDFPALQREIEVSLYSREKHREAEVVYNNPGMFDRVKRAWAVWFIANVSYGAKMDGAFSYDREGKFPGNLAKKRDAFTAECAARLQNTQIECCDALRIIRSRDTPDSFFYCDPPYVGAYQGHYDGYGQGDFDNLLAELEQLQGKFLLSSYRNPKLKELAEKHGWETIEIKMSLSMSRLPDGGGKRQKVEVLTANYPILERLGK